ncbi:MAG: hypothetical protein AAF731_13515 [Bacteroidota bacterium]
MILLAISNIKAVPTEKINKKFGSLDAGMSNPVVSIKAKGV